MERSSKSVWTTSGEDVTEAYKNGAIKAYQKLQEKHIDLVIMKEKSPSCGTHSIYDGSFSGIKKNGAGVATAYFIQQKMTVLSDEEWLKTRGEQNGNRMNALFEFYSTLLTEKQMNYMELYYADDFSLGEIAEEYEVSRQAVYDNIKRTSKILEDYEKKLHLFSNYIVREQVLENMTAYITDKYPEDKKLLEYVQQIQAIEE